MGRLTHPIASQASQVRLYAMNGPLARGGASLHARLALRFAPCFRRNYLLLQLLCQRG